MPLKIKLFGTLSHLAGAHELYIKLEREKPIGEILREHIRDYNKLKGVVIIVNNLRVNDEFLVKEGDEVKVFPVISGG